ncbi:MAG: glucose-6-phosphate isomerase [Pseudomonadota bacterium]
MNTTPPTECAAWRRLEAHAESWRGARLGELLEADPARARNMVATAPGLRLEYAHQAVGGLTLKLLAQLAAERGFGEWREALFSGTRVNVTEDRAAWHTALRAGDAAPQEVKLTLQKMFDLAKTIREQRQYKRVINLGTGGSDLGPRLLADAFGDGALDVRFVANIDPVELARALAGAEPETTLIVVVSKTFATQETLWNAARARELGFKNFYAITASPEKAKGFGAAEILPMWDWVGGRFSVWSAAGFAGLCAIGEAAFGEFLEGGREIDAHFRDSPVEDNVPALMALLGVWNVNFLGARAHAVLPYAHRLRLLPAYLQQLEMESNGKRVDRRGQEIAYATCPVVFGAEGTPSQHSFHQLLHQGTQAVPADFIDCAAGEALSANARAQAEALAHGTQDPALPPHRQHPGHRPSSTIRLERLDPRGLGRLVALYEHKVFTQGVIWNINSFDQWGVELGKQLARQILSGG